VSCESSPPPVDVWWLWVDEARGGPADREILDAAERERAARFRFERHRREFVAARAELRRILSEWSGMAPGDVPLAYGEAGKPRVATDAGLHFSVSHSEGLAAYAVTRACPVGVDVEHIRDVPDLDDLASRYFSPEECRRIRQESTAGRSAAFLAVWVAREAAVKATGDGIGALGGEREPSGTGVPTVVSLDLPAGFVGAVALEGRASVSVRGERRRSAGAPLPS